MKASKIETLFSSKFTTKNTNNCYGVYLVNSEQGRGTDLPTCEEIERAGGIYLIMSDAFTSKTEEQVKGRIGRLD